MILPGIGTSGVGAAAASGGGSVGSVYITDQYLAIVGTGGTQTITYQLNTSGAVERWRNGVYNTLETWLLSGAAADYDARATLNFGSVTGSATSSWLNLGTTRNWSKADTTANGEPQEAQIYVEIRLAAAPNTVLSAATINLYAERV